jgi:hypothetical protein
MSNEYFCVISCRSNQSMMINYALVWPLALSSLFETPDDACTRCERRLKETQKIYGRLCWYRSSLLIIRVNV